LNAVEIIQKTGKTITANKTTPMVFQPVRRKARAFKPAPGAGRAGASALW
jgi:hypothetical protein